MSRKDASGGFERIYIVSDLHGYFLDRQCWKVFLAICKEFPPDRVVVNGDFMDCTSISTHAKKVDVLNPDVLADYSFDYELSIVQTEILAPLRKALGPKPKILLRLGNHDIRYYRPERANAAALAEILETCHRRKATELEDLLKLSRYGATLSKKAIDSIHGFTLVHGIKTTANAAKANLLRYGSGTSGHSHRGNSFIQRMYGGMHGWWESFCFRKIDFIEYLPHGDLPDWCQGFLSLTIRPDGKFFCKAHPIIKGQCEFNGTVFTA